VVAEAGLKVPVTSPWTSVSAAWAVPPIARSRRINGDHQSPTSSSERASDRCMAAKLV